MSDKIYVGTRAASLKKGQEYEPISRVTMWYDDEHYYTAGDDTGRTLEVDNPYATQQIVDNVLESVRGYAYRPFEATGVEIDPAFELGDAITINGLYSVIAQTTERLDAGGTVDISAPGSNELGSEFPIMGPISRELKRRVKLGQAYYGTKITRKDGLTIEKLIGEEIAARVVLNADKLAFYGPNDEEQLYFDPAAGCYKFRGALNVNDNFIVDKDGNVTLNGNIKWGVGNEPNKKRFAASTSGPWHDTMQSGDIYCCDWNYTTNQWGDPYKFVGTDGIPGSDANVTFTNILGALQRAAATQSTFITADEMGAPNIFGGNIYGCDIWAGKGTATFSRMSESGLKIYRTDASNPKIWITVDQYGTTPQIQLGAGDGQGHNVFYILKGGTSAEILYHSAEGQVSGFTFRSDGTIGVVGELEDVHAVFA